MRLSTTAAFLSLASCSGVAVAFTTTPSFSSSLGYSRSSSSSSSDSRLYQSTLTREEQSTNSAAAAAAASSSSTQAKQQPKPKQEDSRQQQQRKEKVLNEPALWEYHFGLQDPELALPHGLIKDVSPPETFAITEEQIRTLEQDGVVLIPKVFDAEWVEYLRKATAYQTENPHFWAFAGTASKLYDYIQRNIWQTNRAFASFYYQSALGDVLRQCGRTDEIRISTDLLMVNPNKGFKWHQDNQNGPINPEDGIRFWITMDETPQDYGAPVYLKGSHRNTAVDPLAVFIDIEQPGLEDYKDQCLQFRTQPGDMLIWHPRTIHKIDGPADGIWTQYRRVLGGTAAKGGTLYHDKRGTGGVLSDLGGHTMVDGDKLDSPYFPIIYPHYNKQEAALRDSGKVGRSFSDIVSKVGGLVSTASTKKFGSFFQVLGSRVADTKSSSSSSSSSS